MVVGWGITRFKLTSLAFIPKAMLLRVSTATGYWGNRIHNTNICATPCTFNKYKSKIRRWTCTDSILLVGFKSCTWSFGHWIPSLDVVYNFILGANHLRSRLVLLSQEYPPATPMSPLKTFAKQRDTSQSATLMYHRTRIGAKPIRLDAFVFRLETFAIR